MLPPLLHCGKLPAVDETAKAVQREFYGAGEYYGLAAVLAPAADVMVDATGVGEGDRVLDVGAGDGNVAIAAARRGAQVVASDLAPAQVERGAARTEREGVAVEWQVADVEELPFADDSFTHVLSAFAAVGADPETAPREMFRVCAPGGAVALTAWPPDSFMSELTDAVRAAVPADFPFPDPPTDWGVEEVARQRFAAHADEITCSRLTLHYDPQVRAAAGMNDFVVQYFGPRLPPEAGQAVAAAREEVTRRYASADGTIAAEYLLVVGRKR